MGMDYEYAGSASYPRFEREICEIASVFGGIKTEYLKERELTEGERPFGYWFGFLSSSKSDLPKFIFPDNTNSTLIKWFNNIYENFTEEETKIIWECISEHEAIKAISGQVWRELELLVENKECWSIS